MVDNWTSADAEGGWREPSPPTADELGIIEEAKKRFKDCEDWEAQARVLFEYDYKFANGDTHNKFQWDTALAQEREDGNRPCLTINKTQIHNLMVINDAKQNKPGVRIRPVGEEASFEGAQIFQELVYHIEYISNAESVYDHATMFQVEAGWGYWRVNVDYISDETFDQEVYIKKIKDPRSVYLDKNINESDGSDAQYGFIFDDMPKDLFRAKYPEFASIAGSSVLGNVSADGWITRDCVRVCEYYRKTQKKDKLVTFLDPKSGQQVLKKFSQLSDEGKQLANQFKALNKQAPNEYEYKERKVVSDDIQWFKIAGDRTIDKGAWLGKYIPIVRLVGTETVIDGILDRKGHTRPLINAQQIYNYNCLSLDTLLPTPTGWTTIKDVQPNDYLIDDRGNPTKVLDISPIKINAKCYKIEFSDGSHIIADEDHLWTVERRWRQACNSKDWYEATVPTKDLEIGKDFIWCTKSFNLNKKELLIDPYILGVWLGDGTTMAGQITAGYDDDAVNMKNNLSDRGYQIGEIRKGNNAANITIFGLHYRLSKLGLLGNKHIPNDYLRSSHEQRLELLQGLMDTDGHIHKNVNQCIFVNTNIKLIDGILELLRSLGIKAVVKEYEGKAAIYPNGKIYTRQDFYRVTFTVSDIGVFKLNRKLCIQKKDRNLHERRNKRFKIVGIEEVNSVPVKCLTVDAPSKLFLAGVGMIPTHNTSANVEYGALQTKSPYVAAADAIEGYEEYYKTANTQNHSYMPYNAYGEDGKPLPPPARAPAPQSSPAYVQQMQIAQNEMMMATGQYQSQLGENENAKSGVAINARQRQGDKATYHFIDNQAIAIRFTGKILIDLIPKIYDTKRVMQIAAQDGSIINLTVDPNAEQGYQKTNDPNQPPKKINGQIIQEVIFNPNFGYYDIQSDTGPSFATRRQEAFNALTQIAANDKGEFMKIAGDLLWKVADFPEADVLAQRYRKVIPPNVLGEGTDPAVEEAMTQAADKIEQLSGLVNKQSQDLANRDKELTIKAQDLDLRLKEAMAREARADYEAETARLVALGNSGPGLSIEQITPVIRQLIRGMIQAGEPGDVDDVTLPGPHEGGIPIELPEGAENGTGGASEGEEPEGDEPPVEGAEQAPDGFWYVKQGNGYARVEAQ